MPTNTPTRETKTLYFQVKATGITTDDDGQEFGQIECYTAVYNNVDEGNDRILPKAFNHTIQNSKSRAKARNKKYLLPMLWNHDPNELIGGWYDMDGNDPYGLKCKGEVALATQRGREYYALAKAQMSDEFSIVYDIPSGGAKYDKSGVRELTEIRLFSCDPVTFAMNDATYMIGVKSMDTDLEYKSACGSTSGPIGPRDESWDGAAAKKWIWSKAEGEDGKVKASVAKKYFMRCDGDPSEKGSYSYPFWTNDHISVGGVKAVANALAGARNADAGGDTAGMRSKVNTLYSRINAKYPDAEKLVPPWKDDDGKSMPERQKKTLQEHFNEELAQDLLRDWQDVFVCSLTGAVFDAFTIGDQPEQDISRAIDDFKEIVLSKFVAMALECDLSQYLEDNAISYTPGLGQMLNGSNSSYGYYGYMSRSSDMQRKAGRSISAANGQRIQDHIDNLKAMSREHMKAIHSAADDLADMMGGKESDDGQEDDNPEGKQLELALAQIKSLRK